MDVYESYAYFRREMKILMKLTTPSILSLQISTQMTSNRNILIYLRKMCLLHIRVFVMTEECGCWSLFESFFAK